MLRFMRMCARISHNLYWTNKFNLLVFGVCVLRVREKMNFM